MQETLTGKNEIFKAGGVFSREVINSDNLRQYLYVRQNGNFVGVPSYRNQLSMIDYNKLCGVYDRFPESEINRLIETLDNSSN